MWALRVFCWYYQACRSPAGSGAFDARGTDTAMAHTWCRQRLLESRQPGAPEPLRSLCVAGEEHCCATARLHLQPSLGWLRSWALCLTASEQISLVNATRWTLLHPAQEPNQRVVWGQKKLLLILFCIVSERWCLTLRNTHLAGFLGVVVYPSASPRTSRKERESAQSSGSAGLWCCMCTARSYMTEKKPFVETCRVCQLGLVKCGKMWVLLGILSVPKLAANMLSVVAS